MFPKGKNALISGSTLGIGRFLRKEEAIAITDSHISIASGWMAQ